MSFLEVMDLAENEPGFSLPAGQLAPEFDTPESKAERLAQFVDNGLLSEKDAGTYQRLLSFLDEVAWTGDLPVSTVERDLDDFLIAEQVQQEIHPATYHTAGLLKEVLINNPITREAVGKEPFGVRKSDDGQLCKTVGFFCPKKGPIQDAAKAAAVQAASDAFKKKAKGIGIKATTSSVIASLIKSALGTVWSSIFCRVECDECAGPAGVVAIYNSNCSLREIRAAGTFEHANRLVFLDR